MAMQHHQDYSPKGSTKLASPYFSVASTTSTFVPGSVAHVETRPDFLAKIESGFVLSCPGDSAKQVRVLHPFYIKIHPMGDEFVASSDISDIYELGTTKQLAARNYLSSLADEILWFQDHKENLSEQMLQDFRKLQFYLDLV